MIEILREIVYILDAVAYRACQDRAYINLARRMSTLLQDINKLDKKMNKNINKFPKEEK